MIKKSVKISSNTELTTIKYALWAIDLPNSWLKKNKLLNSFLCDSIASPNFEDFSEEEKNVFLLLQEQGCIEEPQKNEYTGHEIFIQFERIVTKWYEIYYNHPIWDKLLQGCSQNTLIAWLIQNYHISRSAGVTDSRCATFFPIEKLRESFKQNAMEEYWHCDAFYFVNHKNLKLSKQSVKDYLPLCSSLSFDQQMLYLAEKDPLAYIMVCYFQESSVRFHSDCKNFYRDMESKYELNHFFKPWEKHLSFDFEYEHANKYAQMFSHFETVKKEDLLFSFQNAAITAGYLLEAFDEILLENESQQIILRDPPSKNNNSHVFDSFKKNSFTLNLNKKNHELLNEIFSNFYIKHSEKRKSDIKKCVEYIKNELSHITFRCMSFSYNHDEIQCLGNIAKELFESKKIPCDMKKPSNTSEWVSLRNFFFEISHSPKSFIPILAIFNYFFKDTIEESLLSNKLSEKVFTFIKNSDSKPSDYIDSCVFLFEKMQKFFTNQNQFYQFDFFKD